MDVLSFATGPDGSGSQTAELRHELSEYLTRRLRLDVTVTSADSYGGLLERLESGQAQAAWLPPAVLIDAMASLGVRPILAFQRAGHARYTAALFARADGSVRAVGDLAGKTVAWVDPFSAAGYLFPRVALMDLGYDIDGLFGAELILGSHEAVARAVASGEADVGATWLHPEPQEDGPAPSGWVGALGSDPMLIVLETRPMPADCVAVAEDLSRGTADRLERALRQLPRSKQGRTVLRELFGASRLVDPNLGGLDRVRSALDRA